MLYNDTAFTVDIINKNAYNNSNGRVLPKIFSPIIKVGLFLYLNLEGRCKCGE